MVVGMIETPLTMSDSTAAHPAPPHAHLPIDLRWWKQAAGVVVGLPVALYLAYGTTLCAWRAMVVQPAPTSITLAQGVEYTRTTESDPKRVWHIVKVDLMADGLEVQGAEADVALALPLRAMPATEAVAKNHWVLGFGAGVSLPAKAGELTAPRAMARTRGTTLGGASNVKDESVKDQLFLALPPHAPASLTAASNNDAITGLWSEISLLKQAALSPLASGNERNETTSRLGIGLDASGRTMYIAMIDGRLASSSKGATAHELAEKLKSLGAVNAAQFAHGDAVGMAAALPGNTEPTMVGTPVAGGVPGREPALGFVLGLKALPRLSPP